MDRQKLGKDAEKAAEKYLKQHYLKLVERNYHCRFGEIDLIMSDGDTLVFIEVRFRSQSHYGGAATSVSFIKQSKLIKTAHYFLSHNRQHQNKTCRFDVIAFEYDGAPLQPLWYKDAFRL
ncbi:MAG: YraN family protein [Neptuniibacter caesariensis]|uniref:UPF0102 protein CSA60_00495 n=1 Tax=Neptuniibacter caesariensis TaxID=207954 RepID=A0A2G6JQC9_NEPCE|nr:MAG: YraN family protein [Neptuniibacter caesariensis]